MKRRMIVLLCIVLLLFSDSAFGEGREEVSSEYQEAFEFGSEVLKNYYENKDLSIGRDFQDRVSLPMAKLLSTKIRLEKFRRETLKLIYENYNLSLLPISLESWSMENDEWVFRVQAIRTWNDSGVEEKSTSSEVWDLRVKNIEEGMQLIECFEVYENLTLGPIDEGAREFGPNYCGPEYDIFLERYVEGFEAQCIKKSEPQLTDLLMDLKKELLAIPSNGLILMVVMSLWVIWSVFP